MRETDLGAQRMRRIGVTQADFHAAALLNSSRPSALREFDQIAMRPADLARQAALMARHLDGARVAFVGDHDGASAMLGLRLALGEAGPAEMLVLDFDERILSWLEGVSNDHGFADRLSVQTYNVFDPIPDELLGTYDWFYTNPPYGSHNGGESACLFITRGLELCRLHAGHGCIIMPLDDTRQWTGPAMLTVQRTLCAAGWVLDDVSRSRHRYHLDDDPTLSSALVLAKAVPDVSVVLPRYFRRRVDQNEIAYFYGRRVAPPYPRYICDDGSFDFDWLAA